MKRLICILSASLYFNMIFANNEYPMLSYEDRSELKALPEQTIATIDFSPQVYHYTKIGTNGISFQNIGVGLRSRNFETSTGHDFSFNANISPLSVVEHYFLALPTMKYTYLTYRDSSPTSRYFGIGFEGGAWINVNHSSTTILPVPNIELIWGKEHTGERYSQIGVNMLPLGALVFGSGLAAYSYHQQNDLSCILGVAMAIASASTLISYTVGF